MTEIIIGFHPIEEALKSAGPSSVLFLDSRSAKRNAELKKKAQEQAVQVRIVSEEELISMTSKQANHKGAVLQYVPKSISSKELDLKGFLTQLGEAREALILVLDGITDPQNMGAIIRSADQFGVDLVIVPQRRSAQQNTTVMKVSAGAARYVPVLTAKNLVREMQLLQKEGFWFYGADMDGMEASKVNFSGRVALVMGAEGTGLSRLVKETCDQVVSIPTRGHIDSLNVSVATGILLYEIRR